LYAGRGGSDGSKTPKLIEKLEDVDVVKVYCGAQFSLALTKTGSVYSWGKGDTHRLGHASEEHVRFPKLIEFLQGTASSSIRDSNIYQKSDCSTEEFSLFWMMYNKLAVYVVIHNET
jgi:alpha-tubulin suppressor-like RCC1 family protein